MADGPILQLQSGGLLLRAIDLRLALGDALDRLPVVLRLIAENLLRNAAPGDGARLTQLLHDWLVHGRSEAEVDFHPRRVLMHDTTCGPALVDIAAMRDVIAEAGGDPTRLTPLLPCDVSTDHSVAVDHFGAPTALAANMRQEFARNAERYRLMKWAGQALPGFRVHPPGTGIMHTINIEQLASVIDTEQRDDALWAVPDTMIGTDSHTPMVNGIGVLGWGVGGLEAESVLFGMPVTLKLPDVVGVRLTGRLPAGSLSTDLALHVTQMLRQNGISGEFVEFCGPGVATLTAGDRAVVANMAPEYGATTGYFPIDAATLAYLRATGRSDGHLARIKTVARAQGLWFNPGALPRYTATLALDLGSIGPSLAGPRRPQDRLTPAAARPALEAAIGRPLRDGPEGGIPDGAIAIAAITSCTNTSDPALLVRAGLVARRARALGLRPPAWVKTSLAPGSPAARRILDRAGLTGDLSALGFDIVGFGCTTCIGNSGPLVPAMATAITGGTAAVAVLSGNRNFPGRVHPLLSDGFLAAPPMVVALALAGVMRRDPITDPLCHTAAGRPVHLRDLWPAEDEVAAILQSALNPEDHASAFAAASRSADWDDLPAPDSACFPWDPASTYLRRPPFVTAKATSRLGQYTARVLMVLGDDVTTDHISPAGQIGAGSPAGQHLVARGAAADDLNVYAARRGNWQVMVRGLFDNRSVRNALLPDAPPGHAGLPDGGTAPPWQAAEAFRAAGIPIVLMAGKRYGTGSSRDWAAKGIALMGVRAVLAGSFERIHRSNLISMGVLPLLIPPGLRADTVAAGQGATIGVDATQITPKGQVPLTLHLPGGGVQTFSATAAVQTGAEVAMLQAGGVIPLILRRFIP